MGYGKKTDYLASKTYDLENPIKLAHKNAKQ